MIQEENEQEKVNEELFNLCASVANAAKTTGDIMDFQNNLLASYCQLSANVIECLDSQDKKDTYKIKIVSDLQKLITYITLKIQ